MKIIYYDKVTGQVERIYMNCWPAKDPAGMDKMEVSDDTNVTRDMKFHASTSTFTPNVNPVQPTPEPDLKAEYAALGTDKDKMDYLAKQLKLKD